VNSSSDFVVFRRFGQLHARYLLHLQDELAEIEQQLHELDQQEALLFNLHTRRRDQNPQRRALLQQLGDKLHAYGAYILPRCEPVELSLTDDIKILVLRLITGILSDFHHSGLMLKVS
jgi:hypothetical protein